MRDESLAREFGEHDVAIDLGLIGAARAMQCAAEHHAGGREARIAVTAMNQRRQRRAPETALARLAAAVEQAVGAEHAVVVQRLHDRHTGFAARAA